MIETYEEQLEALASFVDDWAVKKDKDVKGLFTSGDYVTYRLNQIFTPAGWSFAILTGPEVVTINEANAYVRLVGRLTVRFADGREAFQEDIGIWPLTATGARNGGTLEQTAAERYETVEKAARTDCLKNAARNLGLCFAPMTDLELREAVTRERYQNSGAGKPESKKPAAEHARELFGDEVGETEAEAEVTEVLPESRVIEVDLAEIETVGDLLTTAYRHFGIYKDAVLKEAGVQRQEDLMDLPRDIFMQIAEARGVKVITT